MVQQHGIFFLFIPQPWNPNRNFWSCSVCVVQVYACVRACVRAPLYKSCCTASVSCVPPLTLSGFIKGRLSYFASVEKNSTNHELVTGPKQGNTKRSSVISAVSGLDGADAAMWQATAHIRCWYYIRETYSWFSDSLNQLFSLAVNSVLATVSP